MFPHSSLSSSIFPFFLDVTRLEVNASLSSGVYQSICVYICHVEVSLESKTKDLMSCHMHHTVQYLLDFPERKSTR